MFDRTKYFLTQQGLLDKRRIQTLVRSLRHANKQIAIENGLSETDSIPDDFIYLTMRLSHSIRQKTGLGVSAQTGKFTS